MNARSSKPAAGRRKAAASKAVKSAARAGAPLVVPATKPRNPVARSPLLGKGGAHEKSEQAKRKRAKDELAKQLRRGEE